MILQSQRPIQFNLMCTFKGIEEFQLSSIQWNFLNLQILLCDVTTIRELCKNLQEKQHRTPRSVKHILLVAKVTKELNLSQTSSNISI